MRFTFLQIIFGTNFGESKSVPVSLPKGCSDPFAYIVTKVAEGSYKATTSIYAPWIHVRNRTIKFIAGEHDIDCIHVSN